MNEKVGEKHPQKLSSSNVIFPQKLTIVLLWYPQCPEPSHLQPESMVQKKNKLRSTFVSNVPTTDKKKRAGDYATVIST